VTTVCLWIPKQSSSILLLSVGQVVLQQRGGNAVAKQKLKPTMAMATTTKQTLLQKQQLQPRRAIDQRRQLRQYNKIVEYCPVNDTESQRVSFPTKFRGDMSVDIPQKAEAICMAAGITSIRLRLP